MRLDELVKLIIATNHSWKRQRDLWGADSAIARILQGRKSSLQTQLLMTFPTDTNLKLDTDNSEGEPLYSVRLKQPLIVNKVIRNDAEHLPARIAEELLTPEQIQQRLEK